MKRDIPTQDWHSELDAVSRDVEVLRQAAELLALPSPHGSDWAAMTGAFFGPASEPQTPAPDFFANT